MTTMKKLFLAGCLLTMTAMPSWAQTGTKMEAEDATYVNCELKTDSKYSGGKALSLTKANAKITFSYTCSEGGKYTVLAMGEGIGGEKEVAITVNGSAATFKVNALAEVEVGTFKLPVGKCTIEITPSWTWFNIDYIRIEKSTSTIAFDISATPVDGAAVESAKSLYKFLYENFGKKSISGMMTGDVASAPDKVKEHADIQEFYKRSGKYPALIGFDFMETTGMNASKDWAKAYSDKSVALAKDTYKQGGIPAFTWHWRDPSRATVEFYSEESTVKIADALNTDGSWNTSSQLYKYIIQDIDAIADIFLGLQSEGIACIFRPLHEASGGWFWWGRNKNAEHFKKLYKLVFDRMVNVKGVHNVIWVWNADKNDQDWDPGLNYYDVVSADIYNKAEDYSSNYVMFDKLKKLTNGKKIVALSENGPIPDIDAMFEDEAVWSWWMPWYQTWGGNFLDQTTNKELTKIMSDTRTIGLSDMPGWDNHTGILSAPVTRQPDSGFYNLKGQRLKKKPSSGLFISGGLVFFAK